MPHPTLSAEEYEKVEQVEEKFRFDYSTLLEDIKGAMTPDI